MTTEAKRHKRGDVREDGKVFWKRQNGGERWVSQEDFQKLKEHVTQSAANRRKTHPEEHKRASKKWYLKNRDAATASCREFRKKNPEYFRGYENTRYATDPVFATKKRVRALVSYALRRLGALKKRKTESTLGCSWDKLQEHLEAQFLPGMARENRSLWHIDHVVPLSLGTSLSEVEVLNHYTNLRPLWGVDNQSKNDKLPAEHELPADLHDEVRKIWERARNSACTA